MKNLYQPVKEPLFNTGNRIQTILL